MSTNMVISPMQNEAVTREEFRDSMENINERFDKLDDHFDTREDYVGDGFTKVFEHIDNLESILVDKIDDFRRETNQKFSSIESKIDNVSGQISLLTKYVNKALK